MITHEELEILRLDSTRESIERNIDRKPTDIALDKRVEYSALVASQVKYLQRAKSKLPSYYEARCIIPSRAFEQSSSEGTASMKGMSGESLLELTCGLGVDTYMLSRRFQRVVTIEREEILAEVARENFKRLGVTNIEVINSPSEEYLEECTETFDWVYADPDRRSAEGKKMVRLEDCSPNMLALKSRLEGLSRGGVVIKCSPMFDVDEALRLYEGCDVEVVSAADECKEVVIISYHQPRKNQQIIISRVGESPLNYTIQDIDSTLQTKPFNPSEYKWLIIPDVALQKGRIVAHALRSEADVWSNNGFGFSATKPQGNFGRCFEIEEMVDFQPKVLNRIIAKRGVELIKRDFAIPQAQITKQLKFKAGADIHLALTTIQGRNLAIFLKK